MLLFRLHMDKNVNVYTSSEASLRQVITMLFDRTVAEYLKNGYFSPTSYNNFCMIIIK